MLHDSQLVDLEVLDRRYRLISAEKAHLTVVLSGDILCHVLGRVIDFDAFERILPLCVTNSAKELYLHRHEVWVLRELDRLLPERGWHDQDVLGRSLEVDVEGNRLVRVKLEERDRLIRS